VGLAPKRITTSDVIKAELKSPDVNPELKRCIEAQIHVPTELFVPALQKQLSLAEDVVFLDGFPRSQEQVEHLRSFAGEASRISLAGAVHLDIPRDWALAKFTGRLVCPNCDHSYNDARVEDGDVVWAADLPEDPKCGGCDGFPSKLIRRDPDSAVFASRFDEYLAKEAAVPGLLESVTSVQHVRVVGGYPETGPHVATAVGQLLGVDLAEAYETVLDDWELR